ncbi:phenoloxidase-activating factor 2-like isoform X1 [Diachasmimorpha longicaudata]|uniref:phenoloxidase-activating factor 2-like isoform X1 n=1 Tax=Diachasmimorpha longicaudata TaxID=58733 RepID=UPI0030B88E4B
MWKLTVMLLGASLALASPQVSNLDVLIDKAFPNSNNQNNNDPISPSRPQTTQSPKNLDVLIDEVFGQQGNNDQRNENNNMNNIQVKNLGDTFLGVDNQKNNDNNGDCECVPYYQCQNGSIVDDGVGLIDIRLQAPGCESYLDICCKRPDIIRNPDPTPRPVPVRRGCGWRNPQGVGFRITGDRDNEAQFGEFPWMVAILREEDINNTKMNVYQCGGSLIHPRVVLTAAHCVVGKTPQQLRVRAGEWDTQTKSEIYPHQDRNVANYVVHENYHGGALRNDYALLFLSQPVDIIESINVACLPESGDIFDGAKCLASGWGRDVFGKEGHYQVILKKVELPVVNREICQISLRTTRLGKYFALDQSFICAGGEPGKDTCRGDGGSPLVCPLRSDPSRYVQAGIVAWGIGCGENGVPGVYANIAAARNWIDQQLAYNNLDITTYVPQ